MRLARGSRAALIRETIVAGQTKVSGDLVLEMQQETTHAHINDIYRFSVYSESIVSCAFAALV